MEKKAQPPAPAVTVDATRDISADAILEWLHGLPEGAPKEREKARLRATRFRDLQPSVRVGRPPTHDVAAIVLVVEMPLLLQRLLEVKRKLLRRCRARKDGPANKAPRLETQEEWADSIIPIIQVAWQEHWRATWPELMAPEGPPKAVLVDAAQAAIHRSGQGDLPDLDELAARLLAWQWKLSSKTGPRAIRKLVARGRILRKDMKDPPRTWAALRKGWTAFRKEAYF